MAKAKSRDEFSARTKQRLADRVGNVCSFPECHRPTSGPSAEGTNATVNVGEACHIAAASPGGRRYDATMTSEERSSIDNGIWMCRTHAKLIDSDEKTHTVEQLRQWKVEAEARAERRVRDGAAAAPFRKSLAVDRAAGAGTDEPSSDLRRPTKRSEAFWVPDPLSATAKGSEKFQKAETVAARGCRRFRKGPTAATGVFREFLKGPTTAAGIFRRFLKGSAAAAKGFRKLASSR